VGHTARVTDVDAVTESSVSVVSKRLIRLPTATNDSDRPGTTTIEPPINNVRGPLSTLAADDRHTKCVRPEIASHHECMVVPSSTCCALGFERALCALPEIVDACVFGVPCAEFGQRVAAVAVAAPGASGVDLPWITSRLRATLARFKHPRALALAESLPRSTAGKLDRRACAERFGRQC